VTDLRIEKMKRKHLGDVLRIERAAYPAPWTEAMFAQEVEDTTISRSFVAMNGGALVGYEVSWFLREEVHLLNIAVDAEHQGRGIGAKLVEFLLDLASSEHRDLITLEVRPTNDRALALYRRFGFERVGVRKNYYVDDREDAILMMLDLRQPRGRKDD